MLAYDYPLLATLLTVVFVAFWAGLLYLVLKAIAAVLRSPDLNGLVKVLWIVFVLFVPFVGIVAFLAFRGHELYHRDLRQAEAERRQREAAGIPTPTSWYDL
jgi:fatty acid desaturase